MNHTTIYNPDGSVKDGVNLENLTKLYKGLLGEIEPVIDPRYTRFDMRIYCGPSNHRASTCGTSGCAVGWGPFFGIEKDPEDGWTKYSTLQFISQEYFETSGFWSWCFASSWTYRDNTREGAGYRIKYLIEHGLPVNWHDQLIGRAPLTYMP